MEPTTEQLLTWIIQADLTPMEYLVITSVYLDGSTETEVAQQLSQDFGVDLNRDKVYRLKERALCSLRKVPKR